MNTPQVQAFECGEPEDINLMFRVIISDNCISLNGDIDELMICPGYRRGIGWFRGSVNSHDYFLSKVPRNIETMVFNQEEAIKYMDRLIEQEEEKDYKERYQVIREEIENENVYDLSSFYSEWHGQSLDDPPDIEVRKPRIWLQLSALVWLADWMDKTDFTVEK